jgi:hypothetical protein
MQGSGKRKSEMGVCSTAPLTVVGSKKSGGQIVVVGWLLGVILRFFGGSSVLSV